MALNLKSIIIKRFCFFEVYVRDSWRELLMYEISDIISICFFGHTSFLGNFWMHLVKIIALFLLVKSSRYEVQELLKNYCHILLHYDYEQIGHISSVFHEEINRLSYVLAILLKSRYSIYFISSLFTNIWYMIIKI